MNRLDPRFDDGFSTAAMDVIFYNGQAFIIGDDFGEPPKFSVQETFSSNHGKGKRSVCVFEYLKP